MMPRILHIRCWSGLPTGRDRRTLLWADHVRGDLSDWPDRYLPVAESESARLMRATYSRRHLYEMMVEFLHDHFNVAGWEFSIAPVFVQHDRDAIRPQALGVFQP